MRTSTAPPAHRPPAAPTHRAAATNAAIGHLAAALALEVGGYGISVNAIAPRATLTERSVLERPDYAQAWADAAGHGTGQTILVDGGRTTTGHVPDGY